MLRQEKEDNKQSYTKAKAQEDQAQNYLKTGGRRKHRDKTKNMNINQPNSLWITYRCQKDTNVNLYVT